MIKIENGIFQERTSAPAEGLANVTLAAGDSRQYVRFSVSGEDALGANDLTELVDRADELLAVVQSLTTAGVVHAKAIAHGVSLSYDDTSIPDEASKVADQVLQIVLGYEDSLLQDGSGKSYIRKLFIPFCKRVDALPEIDWGTWFSTYKSKLMDENRRVPVSLISFSMKPMRKTR